MTVFDYLFNKAPTVGEPAVIAMCAFATIFTITSLMATSWYFMPRLGFLFAFLLAWICGCTMKTMSSYQTIDSSADNIIDAALKLAIPILIFHCTLNIDYHTLGRVLGPIIFISVVLFFVNVGVLTIVMYSIAPTGNFSLSTKVIHAMSLSMISVSHAVQELDKAQGQVRQLQILLQGEMLMSIALYRYLNTIVVKYSDVNQLGLTYFAGSLIVFIIWSLAGIIPGIFASYLFRQFVSYAYDDSVGQGSCALAFNIILYCCCEIVGSEGTLSVLAFGISLGASKIKFSNRTVKFYHYSHDFQDHFACLIVYTSCGFFVGCNPNKFSAYDASYIFVIFVTCLITRLVTFILLHRLIVKMNLQITWKLLLVAIQSPSRGPLLLGYTLFYIYNEQFHEGDSMVVANVIITCLSFVVNVCLMGPLLGTVGMFDLSRAKIVNMNLAVSQINECRGRAIQALKVDRVIADANWIVVDRATKLQHPYKKIMRSSLEEDEDFESKGQSRVVYCGECGAKGSAPLSKKEMDEVSLDIKHRILKAQRVSFYRQNDNGTLSRRGTKVLSNLVEKVLVRDEAMLTSKDLKIQRKGTQRLQCLKTMFRHLFTITSKKHVFIPTFWLRAFCFRICTSRRYQITMACFSMIDLLILIVMLHKYYSYSPSGTYVYFLQIVDFVCYGIFLLEFIIEILGIGIVQYFNSSVNLVEFACSCLLRTLEIVLFLDTCIVNEKFYDVFEADPVIMYIKTLLVLRVTRIYVFIVALIPKVLNLVDKKMDEDLFRAFDIGKAYIITQEQVIKFLGHLVSSDEVHNSILKVLEADKQAIAYELGLIKYDRTTIATTNKTNHAIRHVVIAMYDCITNMKDEEFLDLLETAALLSALEKVRLKARNLSLVEPLEPSLLFSEIPWLKDDRHTINFLMKHARTSAFSKEEIIIHSGDEPLGLILIIDGLVKMSYVPTPAVITMNAKHGLLPNYDFFGNLKFHLPQEEYISGGSVIGELGIATNRNYNMSAVCETSVQLIWIPTKILNAAIHESGNSMVLEAALWKSISIKIAVNVLQDTSQFRGWPREKLFMYLQGGVVPLLKDVQSVSIGEHVSDVLLIEGVAMDHATRLIYVAPYYIPRTVATLLLPGSPMMNRVSEYETRLFVIPSVHTDSEELSGPDGLFKEYFQKMEKTADKESDTKIKGSDCKRAHKRSKMSAYARKILKIQRRNLKAMRFMDCIPTVNGAVEGNLTVTTFLMRSQKKKLVSTWAFPKIKYYDPSFDYIGDVYESSEIREMKVADDDEDYPEGKQGFVRQSYASKRSSRFSSVTSDLSASHMTVDGGRSSTKMHTEIHFIESSEEEEKYESKEIQTSIRMHLQIDRSSVGTDENEED